MLALCRCFGMRLVYRALYNLSRNVADMEKSLKKLSRKELLELLVKASEMNEALSAENIALRKEVSERPQIQPQQQVQPQAQPQQQRLPQAAKVGSIAEAALQANGYFEAAQRAADDYLREIKILRDRLAGRVNAMPQTQTRAAQQGGQATAQVQQVNSQAYLRDAQMRANAIMNQANAQAQAVVTDARNRSAAMLADARSQSDAIIADANKQGRDIVAQANRRADALIEAANRRGGTQQHATGPIMRRGRHMKLADGAAS